MSYPLCLFIPSHIFSIIPQICECFTILTHSYGYTCTIQYGSSLEIRYRFKVFTGIEIQVGHVIKFQKVRMTPYHILILTDNDCMLKKRCKILTECWNPTRMSPHTSMLWRNHDLCWPYIFAVRLLHHFSSYIPETHSQWGYTSSL
jgi:hypothetical protein